MRRRRTRTPPIYQGQHPPPRLARPLEKLLGEEFDSFLAEWEKRLAEWETRTFYNVPKLREYHQRQKAATVLDKPDPPKPIK